MLKSILSACAMLAITSTMTLAVDVNGVFAGQSQGENVAISLHTEGDVVRGVVSYHGANFALIGRNANGTIQGTWRTLDGRDIPFVATADNTSLQMQTAGVTYALSRAANAPVVANDQARNAVAQPVAAQPLNLLNVRTVQGSIFAVPVPEGWRANETANEVFVQTPDLSMGFGFTGLERVNTGTPAQFLQFMAVTVYQLKNFRLVSAQPIQYPGAQAAIEAIYLTTTASGKEVKSWARVAVMNGNGYLIMVSANSELFDQAFATLKPLAEKIETINATNAFDRANALAVQRNSNLNHPMDDSFAKAYWERSKITDAVIARGSDVRRDSYTSTDPATGQQYYHSQAAYDPTRGGVVNPLRPTELLTPEAHWQGR